MDNHKFGFEKLDAYKFARALVKSVYSLIKKLPKEEQYALGDQLRRAVVSVPSNIAEGMSRRSLADQLRFLEYSYTSMMEVLCQLTLANDLGYITEEDLDNERAHIRDTSKILSGLRASIEKSLDQNH